jgi:hypothetical protein
VGEKAHKLSSLYEEAPEGVGFRNAKNLGRKIARAMGMTLFSKKAQGRGTYRSKGFKSAYPPQPRVNTAPVPKKPRHRKFFGIDKPQIPY